MVGGATDSSSVPSSFSGTLGQLFEELARSAPTVEVSHSVGNRPCALDYFESSSDSNSDSDENEQKITKVNNTQFPHAIKDDDTQEEFIWVEKTDHNMLKATKRKRRHKHEKSRKKRKLDKEERSFAKRSAKQKQKEKEKLLKLEERVLKEYGHMARSSTYQWGTVKKDPKSGEFIAVKENPLKSDNELYYWDPKADKDLLMYERIYSHSIPSYYHAPKRFLGLDPTERARYVRQHQTYLVTTNEQVSSRPSDRYFFKGAKRIKPRQIIPSKTGSELPIPEFLSLDTSPEESIKAPVPEESLEEYLMRKTEEFNQLTQRNPRDIDTWLKFIAFQDEIQKASGGTFSKKGMLEKKMSIYLSALQKNEESEELLLGYLRCCEELWEPERLISIWEKVMVAKKLSVSMWEHYISFRLSHFASFSITEMRRIFLRALVAMFDLQNSASRKGNLQMAIFAEESQVEFFRRYCLFEAQSGYMERAVGLYQAMIEFNCNFPSHLEEFDTRLKIFERFWDSGVPRVGEKDSKGWKHWVENIDKETQTTTVPPTQYENNANELLAKMKQMNANDSFSLQLMEENILHPLWQPKRASAMLDDSDMERVILFADIEDYLLPIRMEIFQVKLVINFIYFLLSTYGGHTKHLFHLSDGNDIQDNASLRSSYETESVGYDMCQYLPQHEDVVANIPAPPTPVEAEYLQLLPREFSLFDNATSNEEPLLSEDLAQFIKQVFDCVLKRFPSNSSLSNVHMNFEVFYNRTASSCTAKQRSVSIKNTCRELLSQRSDDLQLWHQYAEAERILERPNEAKRILDTALSMSSMSTASLALITSYAKLELFHPSIAHKQITLARVLSILISSTESKFQSLHVTPKQKREFQISPDTIDLSSLPTNILPRVTPTRVLQSKSKHAEIMKTLEEKQEIPQSYMVDQIFIILLFEFMYKGIATEIHLFERITRLKWKKKCFLQRIYEFQLDLLDYHSKENIVPPVTYRKVFHPALALFPNDPRFLSSFIEHESRSQLQNRIRRYFDQYCNRFSSPIIWLFAIKVETRRIGTLNRIISLFERALEIPELSRCSMLWRSYVQFHIQRNEMEEAKRIYFRAIRSIPSSKSLWILCTKLCLSVEETTDLLQLMLEKEIRLRISL